MLLSEKERIECCLGYYLEQIYEDNDIEQFTGCYHELKYIVTYNRKAGEFYTLPIRYHNSGLREHWKLAGVLSKSV